MQLKNIILFLLLIPIFVHGQVISGRYNEYPNLEPINKNTWLLLEHTRIGSSSRITMPMGGQDPFPFCFSTAAANLWDQQRCQYDNLECRVQPRTSFLSVTSVGQSVEGNKIYINKGGIPIVSLNKIVSQGGAPPHEECNYDYISDYKKSQDSKLYSIRANLAEWRKYENYTPYMVRMYKSFIADTAISLNSSVTKEQIFDVLAKNTAITEAELFSLILTNPNCFKPPVKPDNRFVIHLKDFGLETSPLAIGELVEQKLKSNTPVLLNMCLYPVTNGIKNCNHRHTTVIIAQAQAINKATKEFKTFYWLVNTWGDSWASENSDGWVDANKLLSGAYGHFVWLEPGKK